MTCHLNPWWKLLVLLKIDFALSWQITAKPITLLGHDTVDILHYSAPFPQNQTFARVGQAHYVRFLHKIVSVVCV